jgi:hypothetical protein
MFERDGTKVVVDTISLGLITGSKVDYSTELIGSQFKLVDNPAASSNCGYSEKSELLIVDVGQALIWILVNRQLMGRHSVHRRSITIYVFKCRFSGMKFLIEK